MRALLIAVAALWAATAFAATPPAELAVKAAFLPKFAPYVSWPPASLPTPVSPIILCIVGADPFAGLLNQSAAGVQVDEHPLEVRRLEGAAGAAACHLAFVSSSPKRAEALKALRGLAVLTVTDGRSTPTDHGIIHFVLKGGRVRFAIDDAMAAESNLAISAKLLSLAISVRPRGRA